MPIRRAAPRGQIDARALRVMRVYLVRHAIAPERDRARWPDDSLRPLTAAGKQRFRKAARGLAQLLPKSALLLTSPFVRARDTARLLAKVAKLRPPAEAMELASGKPAREAFELLRARKKPAVVLVGHEPNLSIFLSAALASSRAPLKFAFKKGGAACLEFAGAVQPGRATLVWLMPPRVLRELRR
jgi:phosphohistidine phosphatase